MYLNIDTVGIYNENNKIFVCMFRVVSERVGSNLTGFPVGDSWCYNLELFIPKIYNLQRGRK